MPQGFCGSTRGLPNLNLGLGWGHVLGREGFMYGEVPEWSPAGKLGVGWGQGSRQRWEQELLQELVLSAG